MEKELIEIRHLLREAQSNLSEANNLLLKVFQEKYFPRRKIKEVEADYTIVYEEQPTKMIDCGSGCKIPFPDFNQKVYAHNEEVQEKPAS